MPCPTTGDTCDAFSRCLRDVESRNERFFFEVAFPARCLEKLSFRYFALLDPNILQLDGIRELTRCSSLGREIKQ